MNAMTISLAAAGLTGLVLCTQAFARPPLQRMGDHPAVVVKRLQAQKTYDYAAQFYPHPAWLYLRAEQTEPELLARGPIAPLTPRATPGGDASASALARADVE